MPLSKIKINEKLSWRDVNDELVALDVVTGEYHVFNDIGRKIWLHIADHNPDMNALISAILDEYETQAHDVEADVREFIDDLLKRGLLTKTEKGEKNEPVV